MGNSETEVIPQSPTPFCWAACLGGCSSEHSREHILTKSTLPAPRLLIEGFPFQAGHPVVLHKDEFSTNILCRYHNNSLSSVDQAGTWAFEALTNSASDNPKKKNIVRGPMFERWLLKTLINIELLANFNTRIPSDLVRRAFGKESFPPQSGLYFIGQQRNAVAAEERITFTRLHDPTQNGSMIAGMFTVGGFKLLLALGPLLQSHKPLKLQSKDGMTEQHQLFYHPPGFKFAAGHVLSIDWRRRVNASASSKRKKRH